MYQLTFISFSISRSSSTFSPFPPRSALIQIFNRSNEQGEKEPKVEDDRDILKDMAFSWKNQGKTIIIETNVLFT